MFRIERSPDRPMFTLRRHEAEPGRTPETVLCAGDTISEEDILRRVPYRRLLIEPDPARAIAGCLSGSASRLVVDLSHLSESALSALIHLRLIRPHLKIVLLEGANGPVRLEGTALDGLPVIRMRGNPIPRRPR